MNVNILDEYIWKSKCEISRHVSCQIYIRAEKEIIFLAGTFSKRQFILDEIKEELK